MSGADPRGDALPPNIVPLTVGDWRVYSEKDPFARHVGPMHVLSLELSDEPIRLGFTITRDHCNPMGFCHGGMLATLLDLGLGIVALRVSGASMHSPTVSLAMDFLQPAALGDWVETRCRLVHATPRLCFSEGTLVTARGAVVRGNAVFRRGRPRDHPATSDKPDGE